MKQKRKYKDSMFVDLFLNCDNARENFLSLFNAIHRSYLRLEEVELRPFVLKNTVYNGQENDVSMIMNGSLIILMEHQSTVNENMPLRCLEYVTKLYERLIPQEDRYKVHRIMLPRPEFFVLYNGEQEFPLEKTFRLSDSFYPPLQKNGDSQKNPLEICVKVYNINLRDNLEILEGCPVLRGYSTLVERERQARKRGVRNSIDYAVRQCIKDGILRDYLIQNSTEVRNMLFGRYSYRTDLRVKTAEAWEYGVAEGKKAGMKLGIKEGRKEGIKEGRIEGMQDGRKSVLDAILSSGFSAEQLRRIRGLSEEEMEYLQKNSVLEN